MRPLTRPAAAIAFLAAVALAACTSATSVSDAGGPPADQTANRSADDTVQMPVGSTRTADGGRVSVRFDARVADSRCPANVVCVWQGDAHIRVTAVSGNTTVTGDLHSTLEPLRLRVGAYTLTLIALTPYPGTGPAPAAPPVATVRVVRD